MIFCISSEIEIYVGVQLTHSCPHQYQFWNEWKNRNNTEYLQNNSEVYKIRYYILKWNQDLDFKLVHYWCQYEYERSKTFIFLTQEI